jgi:hypothetical protein
MLIFYQKDKELSKGEIVKISIINSYRSAKKCCEKYKKDKRCSDCPHLDLR